MDESYDVVVIGAGFGGPVAARKCALAGLKTLLLERSARPGEKVISGLTIPFYGFLFGPDFIRDGNPPIERPVDGIVNYIVKDIEQGDIEVDDSLRIPKPLSPVLAFGYNAYCRPFCQWEADRAVEAGVELRTSVTVTELYREGSRVAGVITEDGKVIKARVVIDAEGSQALLAVKAGVRKRYPPDVISLADVYDYRIDKERVDRILGFSNRFVWAWDEQRLAPPLGFGNGLMVWPYRESIHFMQDQCLKMERGGKAPNLARLFREYHRNITSKLPWWRDEIAPHAELRAHMWDSFEIYVGLDGELRKMPMCTNGLLIIGDAAGLESTELCDGVPAAWFSAELAAETAIEAIFGGDVSERKLRKYQMRVESHPLIRWSISGTNRYDLRYAQKSHDIRLLRKCVHNGWGVGAFTHASTPLLLTALRAIQENPMVITSWLRMFPRYFRNWLFESFDPLSDDRPEVFRCDAYKAPKSTPGESTAAGGVPEHSSVVTEALAGPGTGGSAGVETLGTEEPSSVVATPGDPLKEAGESCSFSSNEVINDAPLRGWETQTGSQISGGTLLRMAQKGLACLDGLVFMLGPALSGTAKLMEPLARLANPVATAALPVVEVILKGWRRMEPLLEPITERITRLLVESR